MIAVFKLGGSLLTLPGLANKLKAAVGNRTGHYCLILPGGGMSTDVVREWSRVHELDDEKSHWLAIASMDLNRQLLEKMFGWKSVSNRSAAESSWASDLSPQLLDMSKFATEQEQQDCNCPPHHWDVTSDSLAAWSAIRWCAEELILMKSVPAPHGLTALEASQQELVDPYFPHLADRLPQISWCNLRSPAVEIEPWLKH